MTRIATIMHGPSVWVGKRGMVVSEDADWVVVELESRDDAGAGIYEVRFPTSCVRTEDSYLLLTAEP